MTMGGGPGCVAVLTELRWNPRRTRTFPQPGFRRLSRPLLGHPAQSSFRYRLHLSFQVMPKQTRCSITARSQAQIAFPPHRLKSFRHPRPSRRKTIKAKLGPYHHPFGFMDLIVGAREGRAIKRLIRNRGKPESDPRRLLSRPPQRLGCFKTHFNQIVQRLEITSRESSSQTTARQDRLRPGA